MKSMQKEYTQLSLRGNSVERFMEKRPDNFSLFSFLEAKANSNGIKEKIAYMKPSDSVESDTYQQIMVEMKLQGVTLKQLVSFLEDVESPENLVALQRISIQENKNEEKSLDVIMQVVSVSALDIETS
jgi:Tfp pilus assembly protein PilO